MLLVDAVQPTVFLSGAERALTVAREAAEMALASHKRTHGGPSSWRQRRREMLAELHRELHRDADAKAGTTEA